MRFGRFSILVFSAVFAYNLQASWDYEVSRGSTAPDGFLEFGLFQRNIDTKKGSFPVASVTTSVYEKTSKEPKTEDDLAKKLASLIPNLSWKKTIYKGVHFYTGYDEVDLRYYKLMVKDQGNKRIQTLATIRQPYVAGVSIETEYLQRVFLKAQLDNPKGKRKKTAIVWESFLSEAQAQMNSSQFENLAKGWLVGMKDDLGQFKDAAIQAGQDVKGFVKKVDGQVTRYIEEVGKVRKTVD